MKKILFSILIMLGAFSVMAQPSDKYTGAMKKNIADLDSMYSRHNEATLANNFERIGDAEKTQWLPYYYAAYCTVAASFNEQDKSKVDGMADKAEALIKKAEDIGKENSETCIIRSMIASSHLMVDPQSRWMQYGKVSSGYIAKAKELDATNPRAVYLEAQSKFYTPEAFGGGKDVAKPLFEKAIELFKAFKPASELHPAWGQSTAEYFLSQCNN